MLLLLLVSVTALSMAWYGQRRVRTLEQELVRRQQDSAGQATEAQLLAKQAQELSRDAVAKVTLTESRLAEITAQRGQLEELIQSLSRARDENLVVDIDAGIRVALQQTAITGSAAPLVAALKAADERLARVSQPRLEPVRRAIARDLDRVKAVSVADIASLAIKLDEAARLVDEAPLQVLDPQRLAEAKAPRAVARVAPRRPVPQRRRLRSAACARTGRLVAGPVGGDAHLLRVTRIDQPQAMLLAPEQGFFLRENLKLRLLNARLALMSRQFDTAQSDLQAAVAAVDNYFDRGARKTQLLTELLRSVVPQARQAGVPRPDDTLAALTTAAAGR
ncbi:bifunctional uroporphyrinogen-III synthetase/uroporphyrin-III C-methyltransferase [Methylibium sp. T29-B]|nr:bifunctional uroporphyrinogen-III synthetase/uroporphyrin-III C-methyltransferase [Methylibium sp. T29-B]